MSKSKKTTVDWLKEFASEYTGMYIMSVLCAILGVVCSMIPYFYIGNMITQLLAGNKILSYYFNQCFYMAIFWGGRILFHGISTTLSHKATFSVLGSIRKRVCNKLSRLPLGYVLDTPSGSLKNILVERIDSIETTLAHIVPEFTSNLLVPLAIMIYIISIDWRMGLASIITIPIGLICYMGMTIHYEESYKNAVDKTKKLNDTAVEYIGGIEVIKAFGKAETSYEKFVTAAKEGSECYVEWMRRNSIFFSMAMSILPCTLVSVLPIGGLLCRSDVITTSEFILVIILALGLVTPLITCMSYSDDIARITTIIGEVAQILEQDEISRPKSTHKKPNDYSITLTDVSFGYHEKEVLHGINMHIKEGTVNALVGPSGSGKSTIAKLIASLWDVKTGSIKIGNVDIKEMPLNEYYKQVAYVSQDNYLFDETIRENIRMGNPKANDKQVEEVAKRSGCHEFIMALEKGYDTVVGGAGGHLSGGERQRIAIARAMLKDAPIVILDEATAYTDPENEALVQSSVAKLVQGKTLIVIAHRLSTICDADQIFVVKDGQIEAQGTQEELLIKCPLYKEMWKAHIAVKDDVEVKKGGAHLA
ncbi:MAG: ABC transporter ATP-binding protein [Cellulosilyticum sp.]|nr:ABC transporter ATP-binding protein [Cellulosilyticum sp.]